MKASFSGEWLDDFFAGLTAYYLTSLPVFLGVLFGVDFVSPTDAASAPRPDLITACVTFDAGHYVDIVRYGYSYDPARRSLVAFFPVYPILSRFVSHSMGLSAEEASLMTANLALLGAFVLLTRYVRERWPEATSQQRSVVLAVFGLWRLGLFFACHIPRACFYASR